MSNRYLEKIASLNSAKRFARAAGQVARENPVATSMSVVGGIDGALKTTSQPGEGNVRTFARGLRNTLEGAGKGAAMGKGIEIGIRALKERAGKLS